MKRCANSRKGCPELARGGAVHYCTDCYHAWQEGGYGSVQAAIDLKRKPAPQHVCVGQEQLAAKDARIAELEAFTAEVVEMHTVRFRGEARVPSTEEVLRRCRNDMLVAYAARTAQRSDGAVLSSVDPAERLAATIAWLAKLKHRLAFRATRQSQMDDQTFAEFQRLQAFHHKIMESVSLTMPGRHAGTLQDAEAVEVVRSRLRGVRAHPTANATCTKTGDRQLDRIEGLAKQAAAGRFPVWPFAALMTGVAVAYLIKWGILCVS